MPDNTQPFPYRLGQQVAHLLHTREHEGWVGHIVAHNTYETFDGAQHTYSVRWIDPHGKPAEELVRMHYDELRALGPIK